MFLIGSSKYNFSLTKSRLW